VKAKLFVKARRFATTGNEERRTGMPGFHAFRRRHTTSVWSHHLQRYRMPNRGV
jgi:hypothetical protein